MRMELVEFGEQVQLMPLYVKKQGKLEPRWLYGTYLGIRMESSEVLVGTDNGVYKTRSVRRRTEDMRWSAEAVNSILGVPWKPYHITDDDKLLIKMPMEPSKPDVEVSERKVELDPAPRGFSINKRDLINHGFTPDCPGCYAAHHGAK